MVWLELETTAHKCLTKLLATESKYEYTQAAHVDCYVQVWLHLQLAELGLASISSLKDAFEMVAIFYRQAFVRLSPSQLEYGTAKT